MKYIAANGENQYLVDVVEREGACQVQVDGAEFQMDVHDVDGKGTYSLLIDGVSYTAVIVDTSESIRIMVNGQEYDFDVEEEALARLRSQVKPRHKAGAEAIKAPMPGRVISIAVATGQEVEAGQGVVIIEAMKMENELKTHVAGKVKEVRVGVGDAVNKGDALVVLEEQAD